MSTKDSQIRATAFRHAQSFEEKKTIRNRVADLVVKLFDIPTDPGADPAHPHQSDASLFKQGLSLFRSSDFDDLVRERNIDDRCGYGLCPRPNVKVQGAQTVWNGKGGKDFSLRPKAELEKWCSNECGNRAIFVKAQLSKEPAWNRETSNDTVRLLDEVQQAQEKSKRDAAEANTLTGSMQSMSLESSGRPFAKEDLADQLRELALERGELRVTDTSNQISLMEKSNLAPSKPPVIDGDEGMIEGYRPRKVRFTENDDGSEDEEMSDIADGTHEDPDI